MSSGSSVVSIATSTIYDLLGGSGYSVSTMGSVYRAAPTPAADGELQSLNIDNAGRVTVITALALPLHVQGAAADNAPASGLPVHAGGVYNLVAPTYDSGDATTFQMEANGDLKVRPYQATHDNLNANANIQVGDADVANGNPVPVSDAGGTLTVDQATHDNLNANANIQIGDADVGVGNPVPVSDNGGTLTVDQATHDNFNANANIQVGDADVGAGNPVPVAQATHDSLNANANIQIGDADVGVGNPVPVADNGGSLTVDQVAHDNLNANANLQVADTDVSASNPVPVEQTVLLDIVDQIDDLGNGAGIVYAASDPIDDSAGVFLEIVASLAANVKALQILDTTGGYIGLYTGAAASEVLKMVIGPGSDQTIPCTIASGTRVSVRRMDSATVQLNSGFLAINFLG